MAWRGPFKTLCEMFPQVDVRIIKGTVLDHGSDITSAVEFIVNEVLGPEDLEATSAERAHGDPALHECEVRSSHLEVAAEPPQQPTEFRPYSETSDHILGKGGDLNLGLACNSCEPCIAEKGCLELPDQTEELSRRPVSEAAVLQEQPPHEDPPSDSSHNGFLDSLHRKNGSRGFSAQLSDLVSESDSEMTNAVFSRREESLVTTRSSFERRSLLEGDISPLMNTETSTVSDPREWQHCNGYTGSLQAIANESDVPGPNDDIEHQKIEAYGSVSVESSRTHEVSPNGSEPGTSEDVKMDFIPYDITESEYYNSRPRLDSCPLGASELSKEENYSSVYSDLQDTSPCDAVYEGLTSSSSQAASIDTLDQAFQNTKSEKDDLVAAIEEIRELRKQLEQADADVRQAKVGAAKGGVDILAKAHALRELVAQRREANEIHAGEVYGERAVLATEARELRLRLTQVIEEKAQAFDQILQIKAILQAQIDIAIKAREAAEAEKLEKETRALEVLALAQASFEKVEQDSKELEAEAEACTKLREFLIDRGSAVDSIQGEVAILCEDVDVLRQHVEGSAVSPRQGSMQGSSLSRLSRSSWHSSGLKLGGVGSSKSGRNSNSSVQIASGVADDANQTVECSSRDSSSPANKPPLEYWGNSASNSFFTGSLSDSSTDSPANFVSSISIPGDCIKEPQAVQGDPRIGAWVNSEVGDMVATDHRWPVSAGNGLCEAGDDPETVERKAYEERMAILPGASEFGLRKDTYDLFKAGIWRPADDDEWHLLDSSVHSGSSTDTRIGIGHGRS